MNGFMTRPGDKPGWVAHVAPSTYPGGPISFSQDARPEDRQPDRELLRLGRQLDKAWTKEKALESAGGFADGDAWEAAYEYTRTIVAQIEALPAKTMRGLQVKAQAIHWCHCGEQRDFNEHQTTDVRLVQQIFQTLLSGAQA
ncbi:hypothetical protein [Mesorhizobium sp.]|uniref:hypothetical protein n=1 Tax=Mesorhizobium sp. TaxID=1871066 RepID=UPI000FE9B43A|nr:hypothetical protein [Mesorhizobium sp.]RWB65328.1 MAG: hypothetical protein EOQ49_32425 [Mesorhizobium sp.]RWB82254.1 MAG: hypothetical protein EOQ52_28950 [Mesorhizobium sp.]